MIVSVNTVKDRTKLEQDVQDYLDRGGVIEVLPSSQYAPTGNVRGFIKKVRNGWVWYLRGAWVVRRVGEHWSIIRNGERVKRLFSSFDEAVDWLEDQSSMKSWGKL